MSIPYVRGPVDPSGTQTHYGLRRWIVHHSPGMGGWDKKERQHKCRGGARVAPGSSVCAFGSTQPLELDEDEDVGDEELCELNNVGDEDDRESHSNSRAGATARHDRDAP